jgi:CBS domain-containing protein
MQAQDIMTTNVVTVYPDTSVQYIAKRLVENRISAVPWRWTATLSAS